MTKQIDLTEKSLKKDFAHFEHEFIKLHKFFMKFKALEKASLQLMNSDKDINYQKINELFPGGYSGFKKQLNQDMISLTQSVKKLTARIKQASVDNKG